MTPTANCLSLLSQILSLDSTLLFLYQSSIFSPCMAANSSVSRRFASLGKRFVNQVRTTDPAASLSPALTGFRRNVYTSVYDKNIDEQVRPAVVPYGVTEHEAEKYWAPHPHTGVFGPVAEGSLTGERGFHSSLANAPGGYESVLEEKAFFRQLEGLEKPQHP